MHETQGAGVSGKGRPGQGPRAPGNSEACKYPGEPMKRAGGEQAQSECPAISSGRRPFWHQSQRDLSDWNVSHLGACPDTRPAASLLLLTTSFSWPPLLVSVFKMDLRPQFICALLLFMLGTWKERSDSLYTVSLLSIALMGEKIQARASLGFSYQIHHAYSWTMQ